jgi:hypothetical protein
MPQVSYDGSLGFLYVRFGTDQRKIAVWSRLCASSIEVVGAAMYAISFSFKQPSSIPILQMLNLLDGMGVFCSILRIFSS